MFRLRLFIATVFLVLAAAIGYLIYESRSASNNNTDESTTSAPTSSYFAPSVKVFRTPYYQFQANESWKEVPSELTPNKYVYRSLRSTLIEHELTIYINQIPSNLAATHVLPVNLKSSRELSPATVSAHCKESMTPQQIARDIATITKDKVTFSCNADSSVYSVIVGMIDGNTSINLQRPDGSNAVYTIYYRDLRAVPDSSAILPIISTFQSR